MLQCFKDMEEEWDHESIGLKEGIQFWVSRLCLISECMDCFPVSSYINLYTHTHTHTHIVFYGLRGLSTGVMVYTVQTVCAIALHLNLALTWDF